MMTYCCLIFRRSVSATQFVNDAEHYHRGAIINNGILSILYCLSQTVGDMMHAVNFKRRSDAPAQIYSSFQMNEPADVQQTF